jgi:predicted component of type VI protein secretion system
MQSLLCVVANTCTLRLSAKVKIRESDRPEVIGIILDADNDTNARYQEIIESKVGRVAFSSSSFHCEPNAWMQSLLCVVANTCTLRLSAKVKIKSDRPEVIGIILDADNDTNARYQEIIESETNRK